MVEAAAERIGTDPATAALVDLGVPHVREDATAPGVVYSEAPRDVCVHIVPAHGDGLIVVFRIRQGRGDELTHVAEAACLAGFLTSSGEDGEEK